MQIPPTSALLRALSALPAAAVTPARPAPPPPAASPATRTGGALAAAHKALAARTGGAVPVPLPGSAPSHGLPRGSIVNILV